MEDRQGEEEEGGEELRRGLLRPARFRGHMASVSSATFLGHGARSLLQFLRLVGQLKVSGRQARRLRPSGRDCGAAELPAPSWARGLSPSCAGSAAPNSGKAPVQGMWPRLADCGQRKKPEGQPGQLGRRAV